MSSNLSEVNRINCELCVLVPLAAQGAGAKTEPPHARSRGAFGRRTKYRLTAFTVFGISPHNRYDLMAFLFYRSNCASTTPSVYAGELCSVKLVQRSGNEVFTREGFGGKHHGRFQDRP